MLHYVLHTCTQNLTLTFTQYARHGNHTHLHIQIHWETNTTHKYTLHIIVLHIPIIIFSIGIDGVIDKINCTSLKGHTLSATKHHTLSATRCHTLSATNPQIVTPVQPVLINKIRIDNLLPSMCNMIKLSRYFSSKRKSGIDKFRRIEIKDNKTTADLYLLDDTGMYVCTR